LSRIADALRTPAFQGGRALLMALALGRTRFEMAYRGKRPGGERRRHLRLHKAALCIASHVSQTHAQGLLPTDRISPDLANQAKERKSGSHMTQRWREVDSNSRSR
jgi:hypothetical protein